MSKTVESVIISFVLPKKLYYRILEKWQLSSFKIILSIHQNLLSPISNCIQIFNIAHIISHSNWDRQDIVGKGALSLNLGRI